MRPPSLPRPLLAGCIVIACLAAGFALGFRVATRARVARDPAFRATPPSAFSSAFAATQTSAPVAQAPAAPAIGGSPTERWRALQEAPSSPDTEARMCQLLIAQAAASPADALALAQSGTTPRQREIFRNAALRGWAASDPVATAEWLLANVRQDERRAASEALAAGGVARPAEARRAFEHLIAADSSWAGIYGEAWINTLAGAGQFELACQFAAGGLATDRAAWLNTTFRAWAAYQPQAALAALRSISDDGARQEALGGLYTGWSGSDPAGLVAHAQTLPEGDARAAALRDGLSHWVFRDPVAAATWLGNIEPRPELDPGVVAVANVLAARTPTLAIDWTESIVDPELRSSTVVELLQQWASRDANAALDYVRKSPALPRETRALALSTLAPSE